MKIDPDKVIKVDLGTLSPEEGFLAVPLKLPFKLPNNSVTLLSAAHVIEKVPRKDFIKFMDECWRVLKLDGQMRIACYYGGSTPFWADPSHVNGLTMQSWSYFDPENYDGKLYKKYKPKPWKILSCYVQTECTMEVLLQKRKIQKSYE